uniref:protein disulfide-isomerase n=1 Tax=Hucho hucho TaxID=62062 RepID=A0A4W5MT49_9TELE
GESWPIPPDRAGVTESDALWCGHCQQLEPVYAEAAGVLKGERKEGQSQGYSLAKVDAAEEKELAEEFDVESFPTIKLFTDGDRNNPIDFTETTPSTSLSLESEDAKVFYSVAMEMVDMVFGVTTSPEVFQKYEVKNNRVVLFKKFDEGRVDLSVSEEDKLDKEELTVFIRTNSLELVIEFNEQVHTHTPHKRTNTPFTHTHHTNAQIPHSHTHTQPIECVVSVYPAECG